MRATLFQSGRHLLNLRRMIKHHEQGIPMAALARKNAEHGELKTLATKMIKDQESEKQELARFAQNKGA